MEYRLLPDGAVISMTRPPLILVLFTLTICTTSAFAQTRIEQNDPAIVYSGNWYTNDGAANTGGEDS